MGTQKDARNPEAEPLRETSAGVIIYRRTPEGPRFLLLYSGGRYWSFPKGKKDEGEGNFRTALREVYEETGLRSSELRFGDWFKVQDRFTYARNARKILKKVTYFLGETNTSRVVLNRFKKPDGEVHEGYGWFLYRDALRMFMHESLRNNLKNAYELVSGKKRSAPRPRPPTPPRFPQEKTLQK